MRLNVLAIFACLFLSASRAFAGDTDNYSKVQELCNLGCLRDAVDLARGSDEPLCRLFLARLVSADSVEFRQSGVTSFDPSLRMGLEKSVIPQIKSQADRDPIYAVGLGDAYSWGTGVNADDDLAFSWYMKAAKQNYVPAFFKVAVCYEEGNGTSKDMEKAYSWYKKAADAGDPLGMVGLGDCYLKGVHVTKDRKEASRLYLNAANEGSVDGMMAYSRVALELEKDIVAESTLLDTIQIERARLDCLRKAFKAGNLEAAGVLGLATRLESILGTKPDGKVSFNYCKEAAKSGLAMHLVQLGCCYLKGWGCQQDPEKADSLFRDAIKAAQRDGMKNLEHVVDNLVAAETVKQRLAIIDEKLGWSFTPVPKIEDPASAMPKVAEPKKKKKAVAKDVGGQLTLTDIVLKVPDFGKYYNLDGRVRNLSDQPYETIKVTVTVEDRAGRLVTTEVGLVTPDPLEPNAVGTFSILGKQDPRFHHLKVDFATIGGRAIPWKDKSGENVHP
ncbi:hypothetical protein [Singulisphaera sp. PoT]|uniref:hypothetical protein n=1 Tax=Singulisphaera sp. PoT TaxID=3411797 RepID=UPI003BF553C9